MNQIVIQAREVSKQYRIGQRPLYGVLGEVISEKVTAAWRVLASGSSGPAEPDAGQIWALADVSFDIRQGEVVGLIGRNGAGKSTLLKILSRVTSPTHGEVRVRGKIGSLLEVGTGFHPELTGRENVFLNGAVLGMKRAEIASKFDEIVGFAEVERFLDTPVKRYSSGMYLRLAFAVAAHLNPDILLVDEVLAVGDAAFQKKCLGKMDDVASEGRTVIFVSHNISAIQRLCSRAILLEGGRIIADGPTLETVGRYLAESMVEATPQKLVDVSSVSRKGTGSVQVTGASYTGDDASLAFHPYPGGPLHFALDLNSDRARSLGSLAVILYDSTGNKLVNADTIAQGLTLQLAAGENRICLEIEQLYLNPGTYTVGWWLADPLGKPHDFVEAGFEMEVVERAGSGLGVRPAADGLVPCEFKVSGLPVADGTTAGERFS